VVEESYLQMVQSVITRLATQSTAVKTWCVTVTAALLGFGVKADTTVAAFIGFYVIVAFAALDAYYLCLERAYRALYQEALADGSVPWKLAVDGPRLRDIIGALRSPSVALIYGSSILAVVVVGVFVKVTG
jgi:hypothetical protein